LKFEINLRNIIYKFLSCFGVLVLLTQVILAAENNVAGVAKDAPVPKKQKKWFLSLKGGFTLNAGNTQSLLFNGGTTFRLKLKAFEYKTDVDAFYGSGKGQETVNKGHWSNKLSGKIKKKRLNWYGTTSLEYDKSSDISLRTGLGMGILYAFSESDKTRSRLAASANGEYTRVSGEKENIKTLRVNINFSLEKEFSSASKFYFETLYTTNLNDIRRDFRLDTKASLSVTVKNPLRLKIEVRDKYENHPVKEGVKRNDFIMVTSLELTIQP
jgi:hypothetical protein